MSLGGRSLCNYDDDDEDDHDIDDDEDDDEDDDDDDDDGDDGGEVLMGEGRKEGIRWNPVAAN